METMTFRQWMTKLGYVWTGEEQLVKGTMTKAEANDMLAQFEMRGAVKWKS